MKTDSRSSRIAPNDKPILLCCDDNTWFRAEFSAALLKTCGIRSLQSSHPLEAIRTIERNPDLVAVVSDYRFDGRQLTGNELLRHVGKHWPSMKRMLLSAYIEGWHFDLGHTERYTVRDKVLPMADLAERVCEWLKAA